MSIMGEARKKRIRRVQTAENGQDPRRREEPARVLNHVAGAGDQAGSRLRHVMSAGDGITDRDKGYATG